MSTKIKNNYRLVIGWLLAIDARVRAQGPMAQWRYGAMTVHRTYTLRSKVVPVKKGP